MEEMTTRKEAKRLTTRFTQEEVEAKVGKRIRINVNFSGVAEGTTGRVVKADSMGRFKTATEEGIEYDVVIEWDLPERPFGMHKKAHSRLVFRAGIRRLDRGDKGVNLYALSEL
jgi:hypothetical protein